MTETDRRSHAVWTLTWTAFFFIQFGIGRVEASSWSLRLTVAVLQCVVIAIPIFLLVRLWRGSLVSGWQPGRLAQFCVLVAMLALAMNHVHALRVMTAGHLPPWVYTVAHWGSAVVLTIALPLAVLAVVCLWVAARRNSVWYGRDVAAVICGSAVLVFICIVNSAIHPLDRVDTAISAVWQRLTCMVLPALLVLIVLALWAMSTHRASPTGR